MAFLLSYNDRQALELSRHSAGVTVSVDNRIAPCKFPLDVDYKFSHRHQRFRELGDIHRFPDKLKIAVQRIFARKKT